MNFKQKKSILEENLVDLINGLDRVRHWEIPYRTLSHLIEICKSVDLINKNFKL